MSSFDLNVILRVITAPNSAFTQIRDHEQRYFVQSVGLLIFSSILGMLVVLPFVIIPFDEVFFENIDDFSQPLDGIDVIMVVVSTMISGIVSAVLFYFIGKKLGGNTNWKKVFSVIFHTYVPTIPMMIVLSALMFLMMDSLAPLDSDILMSSELDEDQILSIFGPFIGYALLLTGVAIAFVVWIFIVSVKALKILNEFGTAKAFGLIVLVMIISSIVTIPFGTI